jgi:redox-sensitive bicupin YhaK (pirin superfamily)
MQSPEAGASEEPSPMVDALDLAGHFKDLGGAFTVRRLLPDARRQSVGPFVFFDHFGPTTVTRDTDDVRPHPHIGLATVTYLLAGRVRHRDSLGTDRVIEPGAINWMTAGRGVVHSERWAELAGDGGMALEGLQLWAALPIVHEEAEPDFSHTPGCRDPGGRERRRHRASADRRGPRAALAGADLRADAVP